MALWGPRLCCCALKWNQLRLQSGLKTQQSSKGKQTRGYSLSFTAPWDGLMKSEHADLRALPVLQLVGGTSGPRGSDCVVIVIPGLWNKSNCAYTSCSAIPRGSEGQNRLNQTQPQTAAESMKAVFTFSRSTSHHDHLHWTETCFWLIPSSNPGGIFGKLIWAWW